MLLLLKQEFLYDDEGKLKFNLLITIHYFELNIIKLYTLRCYQSLV